MAQKLDLPKLTKQELSDAITKGVYQAMFDVLTQGMPYHDFFESVEAGVRKAMENVNGAGQTKA